MLPPRTLYALILAAPFAVAQPPAEVPAPRAKYDSPRLTALAADLAATKPGALDAFWKEVKGKAPLVEPIAGDDSRRRVTFLFRGDAKTKGVGVFGGRPDVSHDFKPLARFGDTDLWFRTERLPSDSRFQYNLLLDPPAAFPRDKAGEAAVMSRMRGDPLNSNGLLFRPAVELPDAPPMTWAKPVDGVPKGTMTEAKVPSKQLGAERVVSVYTPPGYDPKGDPSGLLVVFDGLGYRLGVGVPTTLENLLAKKKVSPLVVVFVAQGEREKELACSGSFADFVAKDLVPWVRENYRVAADPTRTAVGGFSLGGLMAAFCAFRHPDVFGNVLSQSGSFWWYPGAIGGKDGPTADGPQGWLTREFVRSKRLPIRFFLTAGTMETGYPVNLLAEHRRFRDVLEAKGYAVTYTECHSDHSPLNWRGSFPDGVIALFGR